MQTEFYNENHEGLTVRMGYTPYYDENPNQVWGLWKRMEDHVDGVTVEWPYDGSHWRGVNYTPDELAEEYEKSGRTWQEAYDSLQQDLQHYLEGHSLHVEVVVEVDGYELASDSISTDFSEYCYADETEAAEAVAKDYFDVPTLIFKARDKARNLSLKLAEVAQ